jgi:hypothetical protein
MRSAGRLRICGRSRGSSGSICDRNYDALLALQNAQADHCTSSTALPEPVSCFPPLLDLSYLLEDYVEV